MSNSCTMCTTAKENAAKLDEIIAKYKDTQGALIPVLHEAQEIYGYLPLEVQRDIAEKLEIPLAEVYGVVSFYTQFSINPKGKSFDRRRRMHGRWQILSRCMPMHRSMRAGACSDDQRRSLR